MAINSDIELLSKGKCELKIGLSIFKWYNHIKKTNFDMVVPFKNWNYLIIPSAFKVNLFDIKKKTLSLHEKSFLFKQLIKQIIIEIYP